MINYNRENECEGILNYKNNNNYLLRFEPSNQYF